MASKRESNRLRDLEKARILDDATRKRRLKKHLDALEQDNFQEDPHANLTWHKKRPKFDEESSNSSVKGKKKRKTDAIKQRNRKTFGQLLEEDELNQENGPTYSTAQAPGSKLPQRHFCSVCGFHSNYTCITCGVRYCSLRCLSAHKDTRCLKWTV